MKPDLSTAVTLNDLENSRFDLLYRWVYEVDGLSDGAIILYTMARNTWELSKQNGWVDNEGRIYFYLPRKAIQERRNGWSLDKISRLINELEQAKLLIVDRKEGEANKYYLEGSVAKIINHNNKSKNTPNQSQNTTSPKISPVQTDIKPTQSQNTTTQTYFKSQMIINNNTKSENKFNTHACEKNLTLKNDNVDDDGLPNPPCFVDKNLWKLFKTYSKQINKRLSVMQVDVLFANFKRWYDEGINVNYCISESMARGYKSVFLLEEQKYEDDVDTSLTKALAQYEVRGQV